MNRFALKTKERDEMAFVLVNWLLIIDRANMAQLYISYSMEGRRMVD